MGGCFLTSGRDPLAAFARNVALLPVILGDGFRRLLPF
jgi:hypothetical protein